MKMVKVEFLASYDSAKTCPMANTPEYAFIGRSNVGKSSLINLICDRKKIAKVSNTPGKTKLINYFRINDEWNLVDLPGYGFAQVSKKERAHFMNLIQNYLKNQENLICTFVLIDSRIDLQKIDLNFINWMGENGIPFVLVYTKIDGIKNRLRTKVIGKLQESLLEYWNELPQQFITSSTDRVGQEEIRNFIAECNKKFK